MDENIGYNGAYTGSQIDAAIGAVRNKETIWDGKQDKLTGVQGQVVGFDDEGDAVAMPAPDTGVTTFNGRTGAVTPAAGDYTAEMVSAIPASQKGANNGVAELDSTGRVPSSQLPSYVDDVLEYASVSNFPQTGEDGKIYVAEDTNRQYRWSGTQYVEISPSLALGETSSTAYRGDRGKIAYDHSQTIGNPHQTTAADVGAVPTTTTVNGHALSSNISLTAADVGARPTSWTPTAADVGAVPTNRTVNGKALSANISLNASDVGAATPADVNAAKPVLRTATLTTSGWSGNSQTVTVNGVVANSSAQLIYVSPANKDSATAWGEAGVFCSAQGANSLTFVCDSVPSANIGVNISIQEART